MHHPFAFSANAWETHRLRHLNRPSSNSIFNQFREGLSRSTKRKGSGKGERLALKFGPQSADCKSNGAAGDESAGRPGKTPISGELESVLFRNGLMQVGSGMDFGKGACSGTGGGIPIVNTGERQDQVNI